MICKAEQTVSTACSGDALSQRAVNAGQLNIEECNPHEKALHRNEENTHEFAKQVIQRFVHKDPELVNHLCLQVSDQCETAR